MSDPVSMTLMVNGKEKTFTETFIPAKRLLEAIDLLTFEERRDLKVIAEERVKFLSEVFTDKNVTEELIWNGFNALNFNNEVAEIIAQIGGIELKNVMTEPTED
ncbi:phage tail assembly chaperone G [Pediococcus stilesii]|uniref:Phage protein n=1 Tax=Pediococcus stilesii TaxID=331679 RepID=A0A0R2KYH1_9LACO|nr:hypothetical protein [Pediococcus stilesii]KRN94587.1 hypothetical protein IV81_GL001224 [Pediococcus stilesii]